jgi:hypothetical protein
MTDESVSQLDTQLYPDLVEQGGLGPAWQNVARQAGVELEEITWPSGFFRLKYASVPTSNGRIDLSTVPGERMFFMRINVHGKGRLRGPTTIWNSWPGLPPPGATEATATRRCGRFCAPLTTTLG